MWTADDENKDVLSFQLPPPKVERADISCCLTLIGVHYTEELTNFLSYSVRRIAQGSSQRELPDWFAKVIVQFQGQLSPLVSVANVQC